MMWRFNKYNNRIALIDEYGNKVSYGDLDIACDDYRNAVRERCLIFCMCSNTIGSLLGYVASIQSDIVVLMLDSNMDNRLLDELIKKYNPKYIWGPIQKEYCVEEKFMGFSYMEYGLFAVGSEINPVLHEELALLLTTSGSTGSPKLVRQSYTNIKSNTESIVCYLKLTGNERTITTLPMNYTYGLSIINTHLYVGATILLTDKSIMQKDFWSFFKEYGATNLNGVPYTYEMLKRLRFSRMELPSLTMMTQAGGKLGKELHEEFAIMAKEKGIDFFVMYGASEATARMSYVPPEMSIEKKGSIGIAIPDGKLEIVDLDNNVIKEPDVVGELMFYGENVTLGYAMSMEDLAIGDERNGKLATGDIGYFDSDGYFYVTGRKKRFLKVFGNRFGLDEAEKILQEYFPQIEVVCGGKDDLVVVFVVGDKYDSEEIRTCLSKITKINVSAFKICNIDEIPRNNSGKIMYAQLEKYYD